MYSSLCLGGGFYMFNYWRTLRWSMCFFPVRCTTGWSERKFFPWTDGYGGWGLTAAPSLAPSLRLWPCWTSSSCCSCSGWCLMGSWISPSTPQALSGSGDRKRAIKMRLTPDVPQRATETESWWQWPLSTSASLQTAYISFLCDLHGAG